jgi:polyisoprenoid-binding protein YceI
MHTENNMSNMQPGGHLLPKQLLGILAALVLTASASAQQQEIISFDPNKTKVEFTLGDVLHTVHGTFPLKSGIIRFDPATGAASGALVVDATNGDSGNKSRDRKMERDILESERYPEIVFVPKKVSGSIATQGRSQVEVQGVFRMHGLEHPLILTVPISIDGDHFTANTQFIVPYQSWGLRNPSTFILRVSDKVQINIDANGRIVEQQASLGK